MTDLLSIGASGVLAYRNALAVVGDNVANANTPGYVRRTLVLKTAPAGGVGDPLFRDIGSGTGAQAGTVARAYDALRTQAARNADSDVGRLTTRADWLTRVQAALGIGDASLTTRIGGFFDTARALSASPASPAARTLFLDSADGLAAQFQATATNLKGVAADLRSTATTMIAQVNGLTATLADVNLQLKGTGASGEAANALLDTRDRTLGALSALVRITATESADGSVAVRLGEGDGGPLLVSGTAATRIGVQSGATGLDLVIDPTGAAQVTRLPASGSLAGLIEAGRQVATTTLSVDALATRIADAVNAQQTLGVDGNGADGTPLFVTRGLEAVSALGNAGSATLGVSVADAAPVSALGYVMRFDGSAWSLARGDGSGSVSGAGTLSLDGVTATPSSGARTGDTFTLNAVTGAGGLSLRRLVPAQIAAADRWLSDAGAANAGSVKLSTATDPAAAGLPALAAYRIDITGPATANVVDPTTGTVLSTAAIDGTSIAGAGFHFSLSGTGVAGDSFRIARTGAGSGDNGNIAAFAALRTQTGTGGTIEANLDGLVASIASTLSDTNALAHGATAVQADAARAADAVSGVDLDQQAAELQALQAAYRASSQVIQTARDMFNTLLMAVH